MARVLVMRCMLVMSRTVTMILPINALRLLVAVNIMGQGTTLTSAVKTLRPELRIHTLNGI